MKRALIVGPVVLMLLIVVALHYSGAQVPEEAQESAKESLAPEKIAEKGKGLYMKYCALCHGNEGEGYLADEANALANQDFLKSATDEFLIQGIVRGRPGTPMSAWGVEKGGVLTATDVLAIVAFLRGWQKEESVDLAGIEVKGDAKAGGAIYKQRCAGCHGPKGEGASAPGVSNPVFLDTASDGFIRYAIVNGRRGTFMPAFKKTLSSQQIDNVVSLIRSWEPEPEVAPDSLESLSRETPESLKAALLNPGNAPADFSPRDGRYVPADQVYEAYTEGKSFVIIDARPHNEYVKAHVKGAVSLPFYEVEGAVDYLPRDAWIIAYCVCPHAMSGKAVDALRKAGFTKTAILDEGFQEWRKRGYPVTTP
jgi:cytochrome c oxidase cbb3-type subunit 3/ubiquinol-cytochrome c reductase cytochrome c subunit